MIVVHKNLMILINKKNHAPWVSFEHVNYFNSTSLWNFFKDRYAKISIMTDYPIDQFLLNDNTNY